MSARVKLETANVLTTAALVALYVVAVHHVHGWWAWLPIFAVYLAALLAKGHMYTLASAKLRADARARETAA